MTDQDSWADYESGPYCRHWSDFGDCRRACERCGHTCERHTEDENGACEECAKSGASCDDFQPHACAFGYCRKCKPKAFPRTP